MGCQGAGVPSLHDAPAPHFLKSDLHQSWEQQQTQGNVTPEQSEGCTCQEGKPWASREEIKGHPFLSAVEVDPLQQCTVSRRVAPSLLLIPSLATAHLINGVLCSERALQAHNPWKIQVWS